MAFSNREFSTLSLSEGDKKQLYEWADKETITPLDCATELGLAGYKLSFTWVDDQQSWCVSLIGTETSKPNQDKIMTSWSNDLGEAVIIGYYKHVVMCDSGSWPVRADNEGRWG